jgi:LPXTG-motif cell wall-anchored protein
MAFYVCRSGQTLPVAETHWESFIFPTTAFLTNLWISVSGYADDPNPDDNTRKVEVRVGDPLPVTGAQLIYLVGGGVALIMAGAVTLWYTRRRRPNRPATSEPARATRE